MPLVFDQAVGTVSRLLLWDITESESELHAAVALQPARSTRLAGMQSELHRRGFLAIRHLLAQAGYTDADLIYSPSGKPQLADGRFISISHSHHLAGILISDYNVGLDIELVREKILRIAPKFLSPVELQWCATQDTTQVTLLWCVKEAVFKVKDQVGISFKDHIHTSAFSPSTWQSTAELHWQNQIETFPIYGQLHGDYALVYTYEPPTSV